MDNIFIYADGGSRGNPGPSACATVIKTAAGKIIAEDSAYLGNATNNYAEYCGLILGLKKAISIKLQANEITVVMDSELVVKQLRREFKVKNPNLQSLFVKAYNLTLNFKRITFKHVPRERNKEADTLVNYELDKNKKY